MSTPNIAFATPADAPGWKRWLVYSPGARIVLFAILMFALSFAVHAGTVALGWTRTAAPLQRALGTLSLQLIPAVIGYLVLVYLVERRRPRELALRDIPTFGVGGLVAGALLFSTVVGILWLAGSYHVTGTNAHVDWVPAVLVVGIGAGIGEEIITRGVLYRVIEEGLGTWWALAISATLFGAAHITNPAATLWSSAAIAIEAGVLLALIYHVTRSLWACVGLHAAWNIMQGTVYGIPVSGTHAEGFLVSTRSGPDWLSGGAFGAEASVVALACSGVLSAALLVIALRRGSIVAPSWRRDTIPTRVAAATS